MSVDSLVMRKCGECGGCISFADFVEACLYSEPDGYYRKNRRRAGGAGADFYTSETLPHGVFSDLLECAAKNILSQNGMEPARFEFVEMAAEPDGGLACAGKKIRLADELVLPENCVLLSNELLDARPFDRFEFKSGAWQKQFLKPEADGSFGLGLRRASSGESDFLSKYFPAVQMEGFVLERSADAERLFGDICSHFGKGVLVFADYFRTAGELGNFPSGTARAYRNHRQLESITEFRGECDITYSPCADIFADIAVSHGFCAMPLFTQGDFFVKFASDEISRIISLPDPLDARKRELAELISPARMGAMFRVLCAVRK